MARKSEWSKEQCEQRYVQGDAISLPSLARLSNVPLGTLKRWSSGHGWESLRRAYQEKLASTTRDLTIEKTAEAISDRLSTITSEHLESYQVLREMVMARARRIRDVLRKDLTLAQLHQEIHSDENLSDDAREKAMKQLDAQEINTLARTLDLCVRGERLVAGLDYEDLNAAIAAVEKAGFIIHAPPDANIERFSTPSNKPEIQSST